MRARIALAAGLALLATALALTLSRAPLVIIGANMSSTETEVLSAVGRAEVCQSSELIPSGTTAVRLSIQTRSLGAAITVKVRSGTRVLDEGTKEAGWRGRGVTIPIERLSHTVANATVCLASGPLQEPLSIGGERTSVATGARSNGKPIAGRMRIEYLRAGSKSWWSMASAVARAMGFGRTPGGDRLALLVALLMTAITVLASWLLLRGGATVAASRPRPSRPRRRVQLRVPNPALLCMVVAFANAVCWSLITPFFQVDDEQDHVAYVQQLAERGRLPSANANGGFSAEETLTLRDLEYSELRFEPEAHAISSPTQQRQLEHDLDAEPSRLGSGAAGVATGEPPLYYALEAIPYKLGSGGNLLVRMELMRLLSALMAAAAVLFVFLFLRELLPSTPWLWTMGALCAALAPLVGYIAGSINPDAMLFAVAAAAFYCIARGFRRGLTPRLAIALGVVTTAGLLTKLNFIGLAPGVILGVLVLSFRSTPARGGVAYRRLGLGLTVILSPILIFILLAQLRNGAGHQGPIGVSLDPFPHGSLSREASYLWQAYLPPLPGMSSYFPDISIWREVWFNGLLGLYGWENTYFPDWVAHAALIPALAIAVLCARALLASRAALRARVAEFGVYALMCLGLLMLMGLASYNTYPAAALEYRLARYLLPLLAPAAAGIALAARGAGRRWGPVAGTLIVILILAHDVFSQLLVVARYYG